MPSEMCISVAVTVFILHRNAEPSFCENINDC